MTKLKKAFSTEKTKDVLEETPKTIERVKDKEPKNSVGSGCFKRNVMHKRSNGVTVVFSAGQKLGKDDEDFDKLKKHLS